MVVTGERCGDGYLVVLEHNLLPVKLRVLLAQHDEGKADGVFRRRTRGGRGLFVLESQRLRHADGRGDRGDDEEADHGVICGIRTQDRKSQDFDR